MSGSTTRQPGSEGMAEFRRPLGTSSTPHGVVLTACFVLFLVVCKLYLNQYIEIRKLEERLRMAQTELQVERVRLEDEEREVAFLGTLEGIEKLAREKLKYIKRDEVIVVPLGEP